MTGFSADWLALREAADHRARNVALCDAVVAHFSGRAQLEIVDIACGSGSNLRALAPHLAARQAWRLVDHDPALLAAASERLADWADRIVSTAPFVIEKAGRRIEIDFVEADLSTDAAEQLVPSADLVTAAAFFDLVSPAWLARFARDLAARGLPLYAVLTYDGVERWSPPHPLDADMLAAFHAHQANDKGFGPAAGPRAAMILRQALELDGCVVETAPSSWRLGESDAPLIEALAEGAANAVMETGLVARPAIAQWREHRRTACEIGHVDLFATPRRAT